MSLVTEYQFRGDQTLEIKKRILLFELLRTKKVCYIYIYVSDFLQKSLTEKGIKLPVVYINFYNSGIIEADLIG